MKSLLFILVFSLVVLLAAGFVVDYDPPTEPGSAIHYGQVAARDFFLATVDLTTACHQLDTSGTSLAKAKSALQHCRLQYKKFSFLLDEYFPAQAALYNAPAKIEVEEPYQEFELPRGLQQLEALLFGKNPANSKKAVLQELTVVRESAETLPEILGTAHPTAQSLLHSMRVETMRILCLYIEGYDAPLLRSGILESRVALEGMRRVLCGLSVAKTTRGRHLQQMLDKSIQYVSTYPDFKTFDRLIFIRQYAMPLNKALQAAERNKTDSADFLTDFFYGRPRAPFSPDSLALIHLGEKLFHERRLSGNQLRSCASCHAPDKYFADGLSRNLSVSRKQQLPRNTPTLLYAALQSSQFWDGRAPSLEAQFHSVLSSPVEMDSSDSLVLTRLNADKRYQLLFSTTFGDTKDASITMQQVSAALIAYLNTLAPATSHFDRYMRGADQAMTLTERRGFNLFMGKAQCGTCHFFPVFNGLAPPAFVRSEFEVIGAPAGANLQHPQLDTDAGRFIYFPAASYRSAFKTPTVRNSARTAPYMHNGALASLSDVVKFYNAGGGAGIGLSIPNQTLARDSLHLTKKEQRQLIQFLGSLTDELTVQRMSAYKSHLLIHHRPTIFLR